MPNEAWTTTPTTHLQYCARSAAHGAKTSSFGVATKKLRVAILELAPLSGCAGEIIGGLGRRAATTPLERPFTIACQRHQAAEQAVPATLPGLRHIFAWDNGSPCRRSTVVALGT